MSGFQDSEKQIGLVEAWSAHNYHPLPVVVATAEGAWITDVEGVKHLDMLSAYSALNFGHRHPRLVDAARKQLDRVTLTSRAFHNDQLGPFCEGLARLCNMEAVLPMNSGAEAVETAIKVVRRWAYDVKEVAPDQAEIIVCSNNFHGRTTTIVSFSDDEDARRGFGPFTPGFKSVAYGDLDGLEAAIGPNTAAFLVEPIQGEAGVVIPPEGFLERAKELCESNNVLFVADEIQSGLGRTGKTFACEHENVKPDVYILGKALAGGIFPLSAVVSSWEVMGVIGAGEHGSTFGGNPMACAVGREVIALLESGEVQQSASELGAKLTSALVDAELPSIAAVRGRGLWVGLDISEADGRTGRQVCRSLLDRNILCKDTHGATIRLSPPLVISESDLDWAIDRLLGVLANA